VDKLDPKECLLAENVRLDETGNMQSAGAFTHQNASNYGGNVHSLYWNPSLGAVAGVGTNAYMGATLGSMTSVPGVANTNKQKISFVSAPNRVYFDLASAGYWTDMTNLLPVDWAPPATFASLGGPTIVGAGSATGSGAVWTNASNITSTTTGTFAYIQLLWNGTQTSNKLIATMGTNSFAVSTASSITGVGVSFQAIAPNSPQVVNFVVTLLKNGVPVGTPKNQNVPVGGGMMNFGSSVDLWGTTLLPADVNAGNFGFQIVAYMTANNNASNLAEAFDASITIYGGGAAGMVGAAGAAGTLTGTYSWKVTFVAANGEESDGSGDTVLATLTGQQGTLTAISTGDARTVARNVYRKGWTANSPLTLHYLVGTIQDNVSTTYADNMTDLAALTAGVILAGDVPGDSPNTRLSAVTSLVRFPVYHYDRVFWVNMAQPNQVIWSKPLNGFAYPVVNYFNVGDSKPVVRLVSIFGELIIIKTDSIWRLTGTDESSFDLTQTPSSVGTDQPFTVVGLPDKILFANRWGLWVFNGYTSQPLTTKLDLWFKQEDRSGKSLFGVNGFHPPEVKSSTVPLVFEAVGNSEKFYLAYAEAGQTANNAVLVFDIKHGNITKRATGGNPLSLAIDPVTGFVYMGDSSGFVSLLDDWNGTNAGGSALNFDFQHGYQDLQRGSNKALWALEFYLNTNGQSLTPYVYYDAGTSYEQLPAISTSVLQRVVRPVESTGARKMQNFAWRLNGSLTAVNSSGTPGIQVVHVKAMYDLRVGRARTGQ